MTEPKTICGIDLSYFAKKPTADELARIIAGWGSDEQANFIIAFGEQLHFLCGVRTPMQLEHIAVDLCRIEREITDQSGSQLLEELVARLPNYQGVK